MLTSTPSISPMPSSTPIPPTSTPVPMAVIVNGEGITVEEFQAEVGRFQAASVITGTLVATDTNMIVLNELIDQTLLAQGAQENGYLVDEAMLQSRISALEGQLGGAQTLQNWLDAHGYTTEGFKLTLKRSIGAAWMRDQISGAVPETADQVHVLRILVPSQPEAEQVYSRLQAGEDFLDIATSYDPLTHGDLGWFPQGYISDLKIEQAAFALQPGQYSQVIQDEEGYHLLYLLEREPDHPLSPDARRALQGKAIQDWLFTRKDQSDIQILVP
jgi:peptidyl-prolyl cis-trans isomerase C